MHIDRVLPVAVAEKTTLRKRLMEEATASGLTNEFTKSLIGSVPEPLVSACAFLDKFTGLWRYEFGVPYDIAKSHFWGTHMWVPVAHLFTALCCANAQLPEAKLSHYLSRLAVPDKHRAILVEMIPAIKVTSAVAIEFEVAGLGVGNRTVDWVFRPHNGRTVMLDVKMRTADFIAQAEEIATDISAQEPVHDSALLFRSIEKKFMPANPRMQLQGAWICTDIKQHEENISLAFAALCADRVHFAILGDWENDAYVLARRPEDRQYLLDLFRLVPSDRFIF